MKKIGVMIDRLNVGGVEKIALEEVMALRKLGEDAYLVVLRKNGLDNNAFPELQKKIPIIFLDKRLSSILRISFKFPVFNFFSLFHISYPLLIPFVVKKNEFSYLIVHGTYTAFTAILIKWIKKVSFSVFIWDPISYIVRRVYSTRFSLFFYQLIYYFAQVLDKFILKNTDYILSGGPAHNNIFKKLNSDKKIIIIPPGVHIINKLFNKKKDYILLVTAWKKGKSLEYVFEILKKIPTLKVKIVGKWLDQEYLIWFKNEITKRKVSQNIIVIGEVTEKELDKYYSEALALLQINDDRGFGMPALESASHGTTFIIPEGQGVCKLFKNYKDGFFVKEKNTSQIVNAINLISHNKSLAVQMGKHAHLTVKKEYTWEKHGKKLRDYINQ